MIPLDIVADFLGLSGVPPSTFSLHPANKAADVIAVAPINTCLLLNNFYVAGNPIKMSLHNDPKSRQKVPALDEHRAKLLEEFKIKE